MQWKEIDGKRERTLVWFPCHISQDAAAVVAAAADFCYECSLITNPKNNPIKLAHNELLTVFLHAIASFLLANDALHPCIGYTHTRTNVCECEETQFFITWIRYSDELALNPIRYVWSSVHNEHWTLYMYHSMSKAHFFIYRHIIRETGYKRERRRRNRSRAS